MKPAPESSAQATFAPTSAMQGASGLRRGTRVIPVRRWSSSSLKTISTEDVRIPNHLTSEVRA
jgi:hypothetical protein